MLNISIIGIGNAGNQVANLANQLHKYPALAINSSDNDLNSISIDKLIAGTKGSGKDRNVAKNYLKRNIEAIKDSEVLIDKVKKSHVVFIVSSTGGGTGSGMSPLLYAYLSSRFKGIKFILVGILPEIRESIASQQNTIKWLKEVTGMPDITYMLYDNSRKASLSISDRLKIVNGDIVDDMRIISGYYQRATNLNSIDERDMSKIISSPGLLHISKVFDIKEKDLDNCNIEDMLIDFMKNKTSMCEVERDGVIKRTGLIINLSERIQRYMDKNLTKLFEIVGEPLEGFEHDYINTEMEDENLAIVLMAGLSIPDDRIIKISQRISEVKVSSKSSKDSILFDVDDDHIDELRADTGIIFDEDGKDQSDMEDDVDPMDIFDLYFNE